MAAGDLVLNMIINATNNTGSVFQDMARRITGLTGPFGILAGVAAATTVAVVGVGAAAIKMGGDFQQQITTLMTSAGEFPTNLKMIEKGVLDISVSTGTATDNLVKGMYMIESGGYHGQQGLDVLKVAAQGAKAENADLSTVAFALTGVLHDYGMNSDQAASAMDGLIATVANGKVHLQDLSRSLGQVLPIAAELHVSFPSVAGAISMMTNATVTAQRAAMEIANMLRNLGAPSKVAVAAMKSVGLTADQVKQSLATGGIAGALTLIEDHVGKKFPQSSAAWMKAMKDILGGANGLAVDLAIGGVHMKEYEAVVSKIALSMAHAGNTVDGFDLVQQTLNFRLDQAKQAFNAMMITIGLALLPAVTRLVGAITPLITGFTNWLVKSNALDVISNALGKALDVVFSAIGKGVTWITQLVQKIAATELGLNMLKGVGIAALALLAAGFVALGVSAAGAAISVIAATWPILAVGAAIAIVSGLFMHFYQTNAGFKAFIDNIVTALKNFWNMLVTNFQPALNAMGAFWNEKLLPLLKIAGQYIASQFIPLWGQLQNLWKTQLVPAWNEFIEAIQPAMPLFKILGVAIGGLLIAAFVVLLAIIGAVAKGLAGFLSGLMSVVKGVVEIIQGALIFLAGMLSFTTDLFSFKFDKLGADWLKMWDGFVMIFKGIGTVLLGLARTFWYTLSGLFTGFIDSIIGLAQHLSDTLVGHSIIPDMINAIFDWFNKIPSFLMQLLTQQLNIIQNGWNIIYNWIKSIMATIVQFIQQQWNTSVNNVKTALTSIGTIVSTAWNNFLKTPFAQMNLQILNWFTTLITNFGTWATNAMKMFASGITTSIGTTLTGALNGVATAIKNILGFASPPPTGPLATSNTWMPNMMSMFANGIAQNTPKVSLAMTTLANTITSDFNTMNGTVRTNINNINTQFQLLTTQVQTTSTQVNSNLQNLNNTVKTTTVNIVTNVQYLTQGVGTQLGQMKQVAGQTYGWFVSQAGQVQDTAAKTSKAVEDHGSKTVVTFGKMQQASTQTVVVFDKNTQIINQSLQNIQKENEHITRDMTKAMVDVVHGEGMKALADFVSAAKEFGQAAVDQVRADAAAIANMLGHSVPKEGPLKDDNLWGEHMIDNIVGGMRRAMPSLNSAIGGVANSLASVGIGTSASLSVSGPSLNDRPMIIYNTLDGKVISKVVTNYQQKELRIQGNIRNI